MADPNNNILGGFNVVNAAARGIDANDLAAALQPLEDQFNEHRRDLFNNGQIAPTRQQLDDFNQTQNGLLYKCQYELFFRLERALAAEEVYNFVLKVKAKTTPLKMVAAFRATPDCIDVDEANNIQQTIVKFIQGDVDTVEEKEARSPIERGKVFAEAWKQIEKIIKSPPVPNQRLPANTFYVRRLRLGLSGLFVAQFEAGMDVLKMKSDLESEMVSMREKFQREMEDLRKKASAAQQGPPMKKLKLKGGAEEAKRQRPKVCLKWIQGTCRNKPGDCEDGDHKASLQTLTFLNTSFKLKQTTQRLCKIADDN